MHRFVDIRVIAALTSILLSVWAVVLDDVVNNDGILYVQIADSLGRGEWKAAFQGRWPFYSFLISLAGNLPGLTLEQAAHVINAGFTALAVVCFISLVRELGGNKTTVLAAAILILLYPGINEYRSFISRDAGYIAFYLLSLLFFFKSLKSQRWGYVASWVSSILIATLFRIEGIVFVAMLPLLFYLEKHAGRRMGISGFIALIGIACGLTVVLAWWLGGGLPLSDPDAMGPELSGLLHSVWEGTITAISAKITLLGETFPRASDHAPAIFFASLLVILLAETLGRLTLVNAALVGHALYRRLLFPIARVKTIWIWLILLNLLILTTFVFARQFLTGRFPLALSLTLMLAVPFSLAALHGAWRDNRANAKTRNWMFPAVCVLILLFGLDGLYSPTRKTYIKEAGIWLKQNTPADSTLLTNNKILMFYAARDSYSNTGKLIPNHALDFVKNKEWRQYDYLAIRIKSAQKKQKTSVVGALNRDPVIRFANSRGDEVLIFKVH